MIISPYDLSMSLLQSLLFHALIIPLDWLGIITRFQSSKEYNQQQQQQYQQLIIFNISSFLNSIDWELIKLYLVAIICPLWIIYIKFGLDLKFLTCLIAILMGLQPIITGLTIYLIHSSKLRP